KVVEAGDPVDLLPPVAAQLELLAPLLLVPDTVEGEQVDRQAIEIHGAGGLGLPIRGNRLELVVPEVDVEAREGATGEIGGLGIVHAPVVVGAVHGGIISV